MPEFICRFFNTIDISGTILIKKAKTEYGKEIISKEINLYNFIKKNNIAFQVPTLYSLDNNEIHMNYMKDYIPLYEYIDKSNNIQIIEIVRQHLNVLHNSMKINISKEEYTKQILLETVEKIKKRYLLIESKLEKFININTVNDIKIQSFNTYITKLETYIVTWINQQTTFLFNPIHGDPNFSNILIHPNTRDIIFIDPRGFFGDYLVYGPSIYDHTKLLFGLSGYDNFNISKDFSYIIEDSVIKYNIEPITETYFKKGQIETILMISIWMGLPQYLENDYDKMIVSFFHSMFLAEKYF